MLPGNELVGVLVVPDVDALRVRGHDAQGQVLLSLQRARDDEVAEEQALGPLMVEIDLREHSISDPHLSVQLHLA